MTDYESVTSLLNRADSLIKDDGSGLRNVRLSAEIFECNRNTASGHLYLKLTDKTNSVSCIMYNDYVERLNFTPEKGLKVLITGSCSFYKKTGSFQLQLYTMARSGTGDLSEQLRLLREKLGREGLFAPEHKKPLPVLPRRIGVVTSPDGDAIRDLVHTLREHNPYFDILIAPAFVQGENCAPSVVAGISYLDSRDDIDVIVVTRGGGSDEDIGWFNDERIARAVYNCNTPVLSAIGHESHHTIIDDVADDSAITPTKAGFKVTASYDMFSRNDKERRDRLDRSMRDMIASKRKRLMMLSSHEALHSPKYSVQIRRERLGKYIEKLNLLSPLNTLGRGYSYVSCGERTITSVRDLKTDDEVSVFFADGTASARITGIKEN